MPRFAAMLLVGAVLSGCAGTPNVRYSYYPSKSSTTLTVTQTIDCNADKSALVVVNTPQATTAYTADYSKGPYTLEIKRLDNEFADTDIAFKLSEDGRLLSINQSSTGQGEAILKSAITLATSAAAIGGSASKAPKKASSTECTAVATWGGGKPVTLIYSKTVDLGTYGDGGFLTLNDAPSDKGLYNALQNRLPPLGVQIYKPRILVSGAGYTPSGTTNDVLLTLQQVSGVQIDFDVSGSAIATSRVVIPGPRTYVLPIPKAAVFGKQNFALSLADSGAVTSIEYGKATGDAGPLNVLNAAATAAAPGSTAGKAAEVKAQADLIAQQQRLARCQAHPALCQ